MDRNYTTKFGVTGELEKVDFREFTIHMRGYTGKYDRQGSPIYEGDVLEQDYNEYYPTVRVIVQWCPDKAAYIAAGRFEGGAGHHSLNAEHFGKLLRLGSWHDNPELLVPAKPIR